MKRTQVRILEKVGFPLSTYCYAILTTRRGVVLTSHQILHLLRRSLPPSQWSIFLGITSTRKGAFASAASFVGSVMAAMAENTTKILRFRTVCPYTGHLEAAFVLL